MKKTIIITAVIALTAILFIACPPEPEITSGQSSAPAASTDTSAKSSTIQSSIAFTLTSTHTGTWKVYRSAVVSTALSTVTAAFTVPTLTLTSTEGDIVAGTYYITVTESGKEESARLAITVQDYTDTVIIPDRTSFKHNTDGIYGLHTAADFAFIKAKIANNEEPWATAWVDLQAARHVTEDAYTPRPVEVIIRGTNSRDGPENYRNAFEDAAAAYQQALCWKISDNPVYANNVINILNQWASVCTRIGIGHNDHFLASGIYGYQFAVAGELMRGYSGWAAADFTKYQQWMLDVFYERNITFLTKHNNSADTFPERIDHYWANWDLCNLVSELAIGILCDRTDIYNHALQYMQKATGPDDYSVGNGSIKKAVNYLHVTGTEELGQVQESGRDQGHTQMVVGILGMICQIAWNQGDDLFSFDNNRLLKGCEYVAKYNYAGMEVPFTEYVRHTGAAEGRPNGQHIMTAVSSSQRVDINSKTTTRPIWALLYYHYSKTVKLPESKMKYTKRAMDLMFEKYGAEGGGGNYDPNSGGYDQLGFGTLMYAR